MTSADTRKLTAAVGPNPESNPQGSQRTGLVSVVIAAYNAQEYIDESIQSILSQSYPSIEIIVVDDCSSDSTVEIVKRYGSDINLICLSNNGGPSRARNRGAAAAVGEYLCFFDSDDIMLPDRIAAQVEFLSSFRQASAVVMDYRNFYLSGPEEQSHFDTCVELRSLMASVSVESGGSLLLDSSQALDVLVTENFGCTCSVLHRRSLFMELGGFDEGLRIGEDYELIYRVAKSAPIGVIDREGFLRRLHSANVSNDGPYNVREKIKTREKILGEETIEKRRKVLRRTLAMYHLEQSRLMARIAPGVSFSSLWRAHRYGHSIFKPSFIRISLKTVIGLISPSTWRSRG